MSTVAKDMRAALKSYIDSVEATLTELSKLEELARVHSTVIETNRDINVSIEDSTREIAHLYGQRTELYNDFHNATFEGNSERVEEIQHEKDQIDRRISELEDAISIAREKVVAVDAVAIAEMLSRVDTAEVSMFFGPRIEGSRYRLSNGAYGLTPPSGLLAELQASNDNLVGEINAARTRIMEMQPWSRYATREPATV